MAVTQGIWLDVGVCGPRDGNCLRRLDGKETYYH